MSFFQHKPLAKKVEFENDNMCVELQDGRKLIVPLVYFPRLFQASEDQRNGYIISGGGIGIHWESINEDIHVGNLMLGIFNAEGPMTKSA
ncbi:MAG: DUF2442 domain-containing protein [Parachlamydiaceae bacterium]|nr:DUF2442 domain-containing protein [Parachlamydiaceae bacterium]